MDLFDDPQKILLQRDLMLTGNSNTAYRFQEFLGEKCSDS